MWKHQKIQKKPYSGQKNGAFAVTYLVTGNNLRVFKKWENQMKKKYIFILLVLCMAVGISMFIFVSNKKEPLKGNPLSKYLETNPNTIKLN